MQKMKHVMELHDAAQTKACSGLLSTVVLLAIADACIVPTRVRKGDKPPTIPMPMDAFTAMRFLFDESVAGLNEYASWLDMDPSQFRKKLLDMMFDSSPNTLSEFDPMKRRNFRQNYGIWRKLKNQYAVVEEENEDEIAAE